MPISSELIQPRIAGYGDKP